MGGAGLSGWLLTVCVGRSKRIKLEEDDGACIGAAANGTGDNQESGVKTEPGIKQEDDDGMQSIQFRTENGEAMDGVRMRVTDGTLGDATDFGATTVKKEISDALQQGSSVEVKVEEIEDEVVEAEESGVKLGHVVKQEPGVKMEPGVKEEYGDVMHSIQLKTEDGEVMDGVRMRVTAGTLGGATEFGAATVKKEISNALQQGSSVEVKVEEVEDELIEAEASAVKQEPGVKEEDEEEESDDEDWGGEDEDGDASEPQQEKKKKTGKMCETCEEKRANFGLPNETTRRFCGPCGKKVGAERKGKHKMCETCEEKHANFGLPDETAKRYCGPCGKKVGAEYKGKQKMCETCEEKRASFSLPDETAKRYCGPCGKKVGAEFKGKLKMCETCEEKQAHFRLLGEKKLRYCGPCGKKVGAELKGKRKMCETCEEKQASFSLPDETSRRFCGPCGKKVGAELKGKRKMCETCEEKQATYGLPDETSTRFCGTCAAQHGAFNFQQKCIDCSAKGPTHGTADQLKRHQKARRRQWCLTCSANQPDAVFVPWPCQDCKVGERTHGFPGEPFKRFCSACVSKHAGAV